MNCLDCLETCQSSKMIFEQKVANIRRTFAEKFSKEIFGMKHIHNLKYLKTAALKGEALREKERKKNLGGSFKKFISLNFLRSCRNVLARANATFLRLKAVNFWGCEFELASQNGGCRWPIEWHQVQIKQLEDRSLWWSSGVRSNCIGKQTERKRLHERTHFHRLT